jgi:hypothetical protein
MDVQEINQEVQRRYGAFAETGGQRGGLLRGHGRGRLGLRGAQGSTARTS